MFKSIGRIISWCGKFKAKLFIGFIFSFLATWCAAMPALIAAHTIGMLTRQAQGKSTFDSKWILLSMLLIAFFVVLRFICTYLQAKFQETISYELVARDRLAIGEAMKRVSLGYFQKMNTGNILNSITTGLQTLENMGIRMIDTFIGGYLNYLCFFLWLLFVNPIASLITLAGAVVSFLFLMLISKRSEKNIPVAAKVNRELTSASIEYVRGLSIVKSFGQSGASMQTMAAACKASKDINEKIELGYTPANCLHQLALKTASAALLIEIFCLGIMGQIELPLMLVFVFLSFTLFAGIEPISDSAHILGIIDDALEQLEELQSEQVLDKDGKDIKLDTFDICFDHVSFGYDERPVLKDVSFTIPEQTTTAIVGSSGSGKTTICNLIARFYDVNSGTVSVGQTDVRKMTCDSLLSNISMVFQKVYLFNDTIENNIRFGNPSATHDDVVEAAKKARCHDFIMKLPDGYNTIVGEGGSSLSGGEKQRISIARAILKNAPIIILDEATASVDPENEHFIQQAISELTAHKTVIVIAHRLATIEHADQILVVEDGRIVQSGTHKELIQQEGLYKRFISIREQAEGWSIN
ncbi:MAG: ABC transporter ATP-binding protein [Clostridia bacterium]|nr:ABC transporter ATP-binding protein [Clostridia bacterium]